MSVIKVVCLQESDLNLLTKHFRALLMSFEEN